jgi:hypothetical protein
MPLWFQCRMPDVWWAAYEDSVLLRTRGMREMALLGDTSGIEPESTVFLQHGSCMRSDVLVLGSDSD